MQALVDQPEWQRHGLNLDVLALIGGHIKPIDLLNLSRTCKSLRAVLMQRSSSFVWKITRKNVQPGDFPNCPPDLSEPQYAELVFGTDCDGCGQTALTVFWKMRRRYCSDCKRRQFRRKALCDELIRNCDVVPMEWCTVGEDRGFWVDVDQMNSFVTEYNNSSNKEEFLKDARERYDTINEHANRCEYWERMVHIRREKDIVRLLEKRKYGQEGKSDLAAKPTVEKLRDLYPLAFRGQKLLTDNEWKDMYPTWMDIMRKWQLREAKKDMLRTMRRRQGRW